MSDREQRDSRDRQVTSVFRNGLACAKQTGAAVHVLSQCNQRVLSSKYKRVTPTSLRYGSGGWHAADVIIGTWNPFAMRAAQMDFSVPDGWTDDQVWLSVLKYKDGGGGGHIAMNWDGPSTRFSDPMLGSAVDVELYEHLNDVARRDF